MNQFEKATAQSDEQFLRAVGVSKETFDVIFNLVASHIQSLRDEQPMKKRGQKSQLPLVERLLLIIHLSAPLFDLCGVGRRVWY